MSGVLAIEPKEVTALDTAFGGDMRELLPPWDDIPKEFRNMNARDPYSRFVAEWFFNGVDANRLKPRKGVDKDRALGHIAAVLRSFEPKHEHKQAGCAYLLSLWFKEPKEAT